MLRTLALIATPALVLGADGDLGEACGTSCSTNNRQCVATKCRCNKSSPGTATAACGTAITTLVGGGVTCANAAYVAGLGTAAADDILKDTQCPGATDKVTCADDFILVKAGTCTAKASVNFGTEVAPGHTTTATGAAGQVWDASDITGDNKKVSVVANKSYIDCTTDFYATSANACGAKATMRHGGACHLNTGLTTSDATIDGKNMRCMTASATGTGVLACKKGFVDSKADSADACVAPLLSGACDSAAVGTPSSSATKTTSKHTWEAVAGYTCPTADVAAVAGASPGKTTDQLACADKFVPCQKTGNSNDVQCLATCTTTNIKLEGYCQSDSQCTKQSDDGTTDLPTGTGKCLLQKADQTKRCGCAKAMAVGGATCLATSTKNDAIASANVCEADKISFQTFAEGYTCTADKIACDLTPVVDLKKMSITQYFKDDAGTGCHKWNGDISKAQGCTTGDTVTAFAANAECKAKAIACLTTYPEVCSMNKAMCGKKPAADVKSECKCPPYHHKATKSDDPDFDEKACIKTVVGAACDKTPAETFPASFAASPYKCNTTKKLIECGTGHLECKNAGDLKGMCVATTKSAKELEKDYTLCPTTKAPTTAAPSAASGLAIPALAALVAIAFA